ncbi:MAG: glycosyltransferase [Bacteroidales bacterium]|nr:glycosyltransferase [Bacteroidales bacterium]
MNKMEKNNTILYLFTSEFPYGIEGEPYLEIEIIYLARFFSEIWIFPTQRKEGMRDLPPQAKVSDVFLWKELSKFEKFLFIFKNIDLVVQILFTEVKDKGLVKVLKNYKLLLDYLAQQLYMKDKMLHFFKAKTNAVFYDYWFCNKVLAIAMMKKKLNKGFKFISRVHNYDLYDERWGDIGVPFRVWKMKMISKLFVISSLGSTYLKKKVKAKFHDKIEISYLGVNDHSVSEKKRYTDKKLIVSVARLVPLKNIHLIPLLLSELDEAVYWIHFGDGESRPDVEANCKYLGKQVQYELKGKVSNVDLLNFYKQYEIDLFLSLSDSEGVPVSMMEAISFGVPIVAKPVGGIPEIVINELTGFLLPMSNDVKDMVSTVKKALYFPFSKSEIKKFFLNNFNAEVNYTRFVQRLCDFIND